MTSEKDKGFLDAAKDELDRIENGLDPNTRERLKAARDRALDELDSKRPRFRPSIVWVPVGALATGVVAIALVATLWPSAPPATPPSSSIEDLDLLAYEEDPEFFADLDFYDWLASQHDAS